METIDNIQKEISYEHLLRIFQKYVLADFEATADPEYIKIALEQAGMEPEEAKLAGFGYLYNQTE